MGALRAGMGACRVADVVVVEFGARSVADAARTSPIDGRAVVAAPNEIDMCCMRRFASAASGTRAVLDDTDTILYLAALDGTKGRELQPQLLRCRARVELADDENPRWGREGHADDTSATANTSLLTSFARRSDCWVRAKTFSASHCFTTPRWRRSSRCRRLRRGVFARLRPRWCAEKHCPGPPGAAHSPTPPSSAAPSVMAQPQPKLSIRVGAAPMAQDLEFLRRCGLMYPSLASRPSRRRS